MIRLGTALRIARIEGLLLVRNVLVLAGLVAAVTLAWQLLPLEQPLWWNAAWQLGYFQLALSTTVLIAAQLATARARRDSMLELYVSLPASAGTRTAGHLLSLAGAVPASLVLVASVVALRLRDAVGSPNSAALVAGVFLVLAGGAVGVALGAFFGHPLVGLLAAFVWVAPFSQSNRYSGAETWLFPWVQPDQLGHVPAPVAGYPPAGWHAVWLVGLAVLAGAVAVGAAAARRAHRIGTALVGALAVAAICVSGVAQLQPVGTAALSRLVSAVAHPESVQRCTTADGVRYCAYPRFTGQRPVWQQPVGALLALVPRRPEHPLTVRQSAMITVHGSPLAQGHSARQVTHWDAQLQAAPGSRPSDSTIYLAVGSWPTGAKVAAARFDIALAAADWAVGLPASSGAKLPCVAPGQAREAIAAWLAVTATHAPTPDVDPHRISAALVGDTAIPTWDYPGSQTNYTISPGPAITSAGYLLAREMAALPTARVTHVLDATWSRWLDARTTQAQLAAALGLPLPSPPGTSLPPPPAGHRPPDNPVCAP